MNEPWQQSAPAREWVLREFDLFADLDDAEMAAIASAAPMSEVPKGQTLVSPHTTRSVVHCEEGSGPAVPDYRRWSDPDDRDRLPRRGIC